MTTASEQINQSGHLGGAPSPWLTVKEAADHASLSADTIYTACERRELRHVKIGGRRNIRVRSEWIDAWLEAHTYGGIVGG